MLRELKKYLLVSVAICVCLALGKGINYYLGGLPASLYGLLFFALLLKTNLLDEEQAAPVISRYIYFMPIVFLPVCVGIMNYFGLFARLGIQIVLIGVLTSLLGILVVAYLAKKIGLAEKQEDSIGKNL